LGGAFLFPVALLAGAVIVVMPTLVVPVLLALAGCFVVWRWPVLASPVVLLSLMFHTLWFLVFPETPIVKYIELALLALFAVVIFLSKSTNSERAADLRLPGMLPIAILAFVTWTLLRSVVMEDQLSAWFGFAAICAYALMFVVVSWATTRVSHLAFWGWSFLFACAVVALVGVGEFVFGWQLHFAGDPTMEQGHVRIGSALGNPLGLANFMAVATAIAVSILMVTVRPRVRVLLVCFLALYNIALLLTMTRSGWFNAGVSVLAVFLSARKERRRTGLLIAVLFLVLGAFVVASVYPLLADPAVVRERFAAGFDFTQDAVNADRVLHWRSGWENATKSPMLFAFGGGPGTVGSAAARVFAMRHSSVGPWDLYKYYFTTESWILELLNQVGILGLILYLSILFAAWRHAKSRTSSGLPSGAVPWLRGYKASLLGVLCANAVLPSLGQWPVSALFWSLLGLVFAGSRLRSGEPAVSRHKGAAFPSRVTAGHPPVSPRLARVCVSHGEAASLTGFGGAP
jgi:hypothetical protein